MDKIKTKTDSRSYYDDMFLALLPIILCASVVYSRRVLLVCGVATITARVVDVAMALLLKKDIDAEDKSSIIAALTFSMMLPVSIPLYIVVVTVSLVVMVGKHIFGGKDVYPFSLAALGMCMAAVNWPEKVFQAVRPLTKVNFWTGEAVNVISGTELIKLGGLPYISTFDLLLGNHPGAMGMSFLLVVFACGTFLIVNKRITWHVPVTFLITCATFSLLFPRIYGVSRLYSLKYEMLCSSVLFFSIFLINEPATTPKNPKAKIIFGFLCGFMTMIFRYFGSYEIGGCFALLLINATVGFWDRLFEADSSEIENMNVVQNRKLATISEKSDKSQNEVKKPKVKETNDVSVKKQTKNNTKKSNKNNLEKKNSVKSPKQKDNLSYTTTLDIISRAEDSIDEVEFSTQTIDMNEALQDFEKRYSKEEK